MKRLAILIAILLVGVALAGCSRNTTPATNVTSNSATLNASVTWHPSSEYGNFWYQWSSNNGSTWTAGPHHAWGDSSNGCAQTGSTQTAPVPETETGLSPSTHYIYRLAGTTCGSENTWLDSNGQAGGTAYSSFDTAASTDATVSAYGSLATIRSDQALPAGGSSSATISAAGNEYESFQVAVQAGPAPLNGVDVNVGQVLTGPGGATIPSSNVAIYREGNYNVVTPSTSQGAVGSWPDALIPKQDIFYGQTRNAFPFNLAAGQKVAAWVDVLVPSGATSGVYNGSVVVTGAGEVSASVPIQLTVRNFSIPSTSTLRSAFGIGGITHGSLGVDQTLFAVLGLNNRFTTSNLWPFPDSRFKLIKPLLDGTDPRVKLPGAKLTALHQSACGSGCLESWKSLADAKPSVASVFFDYICDEPSDFTQCNTISSQASSRSGRGVRQLITTDTARVPSYVTDLSPLVNDIVRDGQAPYDAWLAGGANRRLWPYTSCRSANGTGWAGYFIDEPASQARAFSWLAFNASATGELYWNTTSMLDSAWTNQLASSGCRGNGDGNLFYPGTPSVIGGTTPIPIESIRMKRIRDGREDYEYLHILQQQGKTSQARAVVQGLFPAWNQTKVSASALEAARAQLVALIG
ncbi:MAG: glycoside hydrolase domain-containing protein [Actinomycetota bacterium]